MTQSEDTNRFENGQLRWWQGVALKEELKVIMVILHLSKVKSHLETFVRGGLKPSYPSEYSFNVI